MKHIIILGIDEIIDKVKNKITGEDRNVFLVTVIVAIIFYFPMLTLWLGNPDSFWNGMVYKNGSDWENRLGRFGVTPIYWLKQYIISPTASTLFSYIMLSLICILLRRLLGICQRWQTLCMILLIVLTPNVVSVLTYYYCSDIYFLAYLLNVAGIYLVTYKSGKRYLVTSVIMMTYALSCYQAYISIAIVICVFVLFKRFMEGKEAIENIVKLAGTYVTLILSSGFLYGIIFKILQVAYQIEVSDRVKFPDLGNMFKFAVNVYRYFVGYFLTNSFLYNDWGSRKFWNLCIIIFICLLLAVYILKIRRNMIYFLGAVVLFCLPLACMIVWVIVPGVDIYGETGLLTIPAVNYLYLLPIIILSLEDWDFKSNSRKLLEWICGVLYFKVITLLIVFAFAFQGYMHLNMNRMYTMAGEIIVQVETIGSMSGEEELPVVFVGELPKMEYHNALIDPVYGTIAEYGVVWKNYNSMQQSWMYFLRHMAGKGYETIEEEEYRKIIKTEEFEKMPLFPAEGAVKLIDNTIVVKLNTVNEE